jgi:hypothetical protein
MGDGKQETGDGAKFRDSETGEAIREIGKRRPKTGNVRQTK